MYNVMGEFMQQFYIDKKLNINDEYLFDKDDSHHIKNVLRMNKGETVRLVFEKDAYLAKIDYLNKEPFAVVFEVDEYKRDLNCKITLIQGLIKLDKWDLILQKATEFGVSQIVPLYSSRVNLKKDIVINKKERWEKIVVEACKQCKRESIVLVNDLINIDDCKNFMSEINLVAYELDFNKNNNILNYLKSNKSVTIIIGCEGGFSESEIKKLNDIGFLNVGLGKRILRAESASMYALSLISAINEA